MPVLGDQVDAGPDGVGGAAGRVGLAVEFHGAGGEGFRAEEAAGQFRLAGAQQADDAGDFARSQVQVLGCTAVQEPHAAQGEEGLAGRRLGAGAGGGRFLGLGEHGAQGAVPVEGLDLVLGETAVSKNDQAVRQCVDLAEAVGDVEDRDAVVAHFLDQREQALRFRRGERGGRFVEDQEPGAGGQGSGEDQQLAVGDAEFGDVPFEEGVAPAEVEGGLDLAGAGQHAAPVEERVAARLGQLFEDQVLGDGEAGHDALADPLVHRLDAQLAGGERRLEGGPHPVHRHFAAVVRVDAGKDLDERGLAGPVRAEQRDDAARCDVQRDGLQDRSAAEGHADVAQPDRRRGRRGVGRLGRLGGLRRLSGRHWRSSRPC